MIANGQNPIIHSSVSTTGYTPFIRTIIDYRYSYITELSDFTKKDFLGYSVWGLEKLDGDFVSFVVDEKSDIMLKSKWAAITDKDNNHKDYLNAIITCKDNLTSLMKSFKEIPFIIYGEIIGGFATDKIKYFEDPKKIEIRWFDFFVNENYMNIDDFNAVCARHGLKTAPILFFDLFNEEKLIELSTSISKVAEIPDTKVEGLIIRPFIDDYTSNSRSIAKLTNPTYKKKATFNTPSIIEFPSKIVEGVKDVAYREVEKLLNEHITIERIMFWNLKLKEINVSLDNGSLKKAMPFIVQDSLTELRTKIEEIVKTKQVTEKIMRKSIKKLLPKMVLTKYKELLKSQEDINGQQQIQGI
jgi:hypothetical protein